MSVKLIALLLAALAFAGIGLWGQQQRLAATKAKAEVHALNQRNEALSGALVAADKDARRIARISDARQVKINQLALTAQRTQKALDEALKANRAWADAPVPDSVWDALAPTDRSVPPGPGVDASRPDPGASGPGQRGVGELGESPA